MANEVMRISNLTKKFRIYQDKGSTLKEKLLFKNRRKYKEQVVLDKVSFSVNKGEMVALIGGNGSGKSTLLKLLSRIIFPDSGDILTDGKVSSLLELGAGFHPDFNGIENIYMNASVLGISKAKIDERLDDIIRFSELEEFIYNSVRTYSSGMYMRLAFATAINVDPDILLVDEVLAVGDASFQKKCLAKILDLKEKGTTIVLVTHDHGVVQNICDRAVWLNDGEIRYDGDPQLAVNHYLQYLAKKDAKLLESDESILKETKDITEDSNEEVIDEKESENRWGSNEVEITNITLQDKMMKKTTYIEAGTDVSIAIELIKNKEVSGEIIVGMAIFNDQHIRCYGTNSKLDRVSMNFDGNLAKIRLDLMNIELVNGLYFIDIAAHSTEGRMYDYQKGILKFVVNSDEQDVGIYRIKHTWNIIT